MASEIKVDTIVNAGGDNDTGIDLATNDQILLKVANATRLTMNSTGQTTIVGEGGTTTTSVQQGLVKAWSGIDAHTSVSQFDSFNIASITDTSAGLQSHNLTNAFSQTNYCCTAGTNGSGIENFGAVEVQNGVTVTTSLMATRTYKTATNALADMNSVFVIGHGDLA